MCPALQVMLLLGQQRRQTALQVLLLLGQLHRLLAVHRCSRHTAMEAGL